MQEGMQGGLQGYMQGNIPIKEKEGKENASPQREDAETDQEGIEKWFKTESESYNEWLRMKYERDFQNWKRKQWEGPYMARYVQELEEIWERKKGREAKREKARKKYTAKVEVLQKNRKGDWTWSSEEEGYTETGGEK